jgi:phosphate transport system substrate-binding protein
MIRTVRSRVVAAALLALGVLAVSTTSAGAQSSGGINISGSSTVEPITSLIAEKFAEKNPDVAVRVDGPGTTDGFKLFCQGQTDISDASRAITSSEAQACASNGVPYTALQIGIDGLSVVTSKANKAVKCLSFEDLYALTGPEAEGFKNWSDANTLATEIGGTGNFPNAKLAITAPGEESGTYGSYIEIALEPTAKKRIAAGKLTADKQKTTRKDYQSSPNDNTIIKGVSGTKTSLGWVGYAFAVENEDKIREIPIKGTPTGSCVAPTPKTIADGTYPLSRPLFIYVNNAKAKSNPDLKKFVDFYVSSAGFKSVAEADYIRMPKADETATVTAWQGAGV